jgi:hypothetical protein
LLHAEPLSRPCSAGSGATIQTGRLPPPFGRLRNFRIKSSKRRSVTRCCSRPRSSRGRGYKGEMRRAETGRHTGGVSPRPLRVPRSRCAAVCRAMGSDCVFSYQKYQSDHRTPPVNDDVNFPSSASIDPKVRVDIMPLADLVGCVELREELVVHQGCRPIHGLFLAGPRVEPGRAITRLAGLPGPALLGPGLAGAAVLRRGGTRVR